MVFYVITAKNRVPLPLLGFRNRVMNFWNGVLGPFICFSNELKQKIAVIAITHKTFEQRQTRLDSST